MVVLYLLIQVFGSGINRIAMDKKELMIAEVKRGDINITIDGYGYLASKKQQLLTTDSRATVTEILLKPGAEVNKGSVIAILSDPALQRQRERAQFALMEEQANLKQLGLNQQRQLLQEKAERAKLVAEHKATKLRMAAQQKLITSGIVSQLDHQAISLHEAQLKQRLTILAEADQQLVLINTAALTVQKERVAQRQSQLDSIVNRVSKLIIKANFAGVLQKLSVKLGQSVEAGQEVAVIGSTRELIALVKVSQNQAEQLLIDQRVEIDTRVATIIGEIKRIDPIVVENTVQVEIALPLQLPKGAWPQQNIDATIMVQTLKNVLYLKRPANIKANSKQSLYKVDQSQTKATRTELTIGQKTAGNIEITAGAKVGERYIISNLNNYQQSEIALN